MNHAPDPGADRILASLPHAVILLRSDLTIHRVNTAGEILLGQGEGRLVGRALSDAITFVEPRLIEMMADSEVRVNARDVSATVGGHVAGPVHVSLAPVFGWTGWRVLTLIRPVEVEALEGAAGPDGDDSMLRAPEILAHEIKNPLAGIRGAAQLIARRLGEEGRELTGLIASEVDRIAALIDQMQSLSRKSSDPSEPINLHLAVRRARAVLEMSEPHIRIVEDYDPSLPEVMASVNALVQILLNLMSNAADASRGEKDPVIMLRTKFASGIKLHPRGGDAPIRLPIEIRVSNNGPRIDPALRAHIFEPFVSAKQHGQGLGLALVRKMVRDMHGRITHDRDEARGLTHFRIHLPVAGTLSHTLSEQPERTTP
ncbi:ATP-binding protein [uncultured Croceicoccus sp.]|uniref:two-component system sensor histidine kinase NtrB n=1 Tax=uncultured Croceicoccus sp. TaxID=1295329 RepID=UPI002612EECE|nr:ATP-binding protein [uncultured Croceicoccus sp.]